MLTIHKGKRCNQGPGAGQGLDACLCIHAEENALLEAGRERVGKGSVLYCDTYVSLIWFFSLKANNSVDALA
jgi:deoxycytidylate deaminase